MIKDEVTDMKDKILELVPGSVKKLLQKKLKMETDASLIWLWMMQLLMDLNRSK